MQTVTENTPLVMVTLGQLCEFLQGQQALQAQQPQQMQGGKRFVYGIKGIRNLFNVSHTTAQRYKNTILAEAVSQQGKKIIVDVEKAVQLFSEHKTPVKP